MDGGVVCVQVGFKRVIGLPGDYSYQWRERQLMVMITAEGPTCVLTIADMQVGNATPASSAECATCRVVCMCNALSSRTGILV